VRRTELPMLDIELVFAAGSARDGDQPGAAALTNAMIGEGAQNLSTDTIAENFAVNGAQFQPFMNRDMAGVMLRTLSDAKYLTPALQNFKTVISTPTFPEAELNRVKQQCIAQLKSQAQDPSQVASNRFYQLLYQHHFYAHNPLGNTESLNAIKQAQLIDFYKKYYTSENADLILVGDITELQAKKIAEEVAGNLPSGTEAIPLSVAENIKNPAVNDITFPSTQSTLMIGQVGITRENPDYFPLLLGNAVLGGLPMTSILYDEIREKRGLAYVVESDFNPLQYRGPFMIYLQTKSSTVSTADDLAKAVLKKFIQEGPTESQLNAAKKNMIASLPLSLSSNHSILGLLTNIAFYHRPLNYLDTYQSKVDAVTTDQVKKAFQKNIDVDRLVTVVVGNK